MLGKLLKHEFTATGRVMWVIYVAILGLSVMAHFAFGALNDPATDVQLVRALMMMTIAVWVISLIIGYVASVVLMVKRFHKNLLTDEGYLMFTLPGTVHHLVISKLIAAAMWLVVSFLVIALGVFIAAAGEDVISDLRFFFGFMFYGEMTALQAANTITIIVETLVVLLLGAAATCLAFYSAMAIGHGFTNHKVLWSVVFYFVQETALQILGTVLSVGLLSQIETGPSWLWDLTTVQTWHLGILSVCVAELIIGAVFYILTVVNLQKRLNLT